MLWIDDEVAHLGDLLPAKTFIQSIRHTRSEFAVSLLKCRENFIEAIEFFQTRHRMAEHVEATLEIKTLHHFIHESGVVRGIDGFQHVEQLLASGC